MWIIISLDLVMQGLYKLVFSYPKMFPKFSNFLILLILPYPRRVNRFRKPFASQKGRKGVYFIGSVCKNPVSIRSHPPALLIPPEQGGTGFWKMAYAVWSGTVD